MEQSDGAEHCGGQDERHQEFDEGCHLEGHRCYDSRRRGFAEYRGAYPKSNSVASVESRVTLLLKIRMAARHTGSTTVFP